MLNAMMTAMLRRGLGPPGIWLLTTRGRKTGRQRTTPVSLVDMDGTRYVVSPYGTPAWVHNARAAGEVTLQRGKRAETLSIAELEPEQAAPILNSTSSTSASCARGSTPGPRRRWRRSSPRPQATRSSG